MADAEAAVVVSAPEHAAVLAPIARRHGARLILLPPSPEQWIRRATGPLGEPVLPGIDRARPAMILYTSGTTSRPKGVVTTHAALEARVATLVGAWEWSAADRILHVLPLNQSRR